MKFILIGFTNSGKTSFGRSLSSILMCPFYDLDRLIEEKYGEKKPKLTVREITLKEGVSFFRNLEKNVLKNFLKDFRSGVLALGGGTLLDPSNRNLPKDSKLVYIEADLSNVFQRIKQQGLPATMNQALDPQRELKKNLDQRLPIYKKLAHLTIKNNGSLADLYQEALKLSHI